MPVGFDLISDLNLSAESEFNWEGKATSLFCVVAGNVSNNLRVIHKTLMHLSRYYQGIFYIAGSLEYDGLVDLNTRTEELEKICSNIKNVAFLHHNVVIIDGVAILGCNGWYGNTLPNDDETNEIVTQLYYEDLLYLKSSIEKLQRHLDVKKIFIVTNSVPNKNLHFGEEPEYILDKVPLDMVLDSDTMDKVCVWSYGTYRKIVDTTINDINYFCNPCFSNPNYWAKRIEI